MDFLQELIRQIILFEARNFLAPLDLQLRHRHQAAVDILRICQQSGFVVGVDGHLQPVDALQVLITHNVGNPPFFNEEPLHRLVVFFGILQLLVAIRDRGVQMFVV